MTAASTMRVSARTRDRVMRIAREDYGGVTADEALVRLIDEHWRRQAIAAVDRLRAEDPAAYDDYLAEMHVIADSDVAVDEPWEPAG